MAQTPPSITWHMAICAQCSDGFRDQISAVPFRTRKERHTWVDEHMEATGHHVLLMDQRAVVTVKPAESG